MLAVVLFALVLSSASTFGVSYAAVELAKETEPNANGVMVISGSGENRPALSPEPTIMDGIVIVRGLNRRLLQGEQIQVRDMTIPQSRVAEACQLFHQGAASNLVVAVDGVDYRVSTTQFDHSCVTASGSYDGGFWNVFCPEGHDECDISIQVHQSQSEGNFSQSGRRLTTRRSFEDTTRCKHKIPRRYRSYIYFDPLWYFNALCSRNPIANAVWDYGECGCIPGPAIPHCDEYRYEIVQDDYENLGCLTCKEGYTLNPITARTCSECDSGLPSEGHQCYGCPEGYTCDNPMSQSSCCRACPSLFTTQGNQCYGCPAGYTCTDPHNEASCCQACSSGFSSSGLLCSGCPAGYSCNELNSHSSCCHPCASGLSSNGTQCRGCPEGYTCDDPSSESSCCQETSSGFPSTGRMCAGCGEGYTCDDPKGYSSWCTACASGLSSTWFGCHGCPDGYSCNQLRHPSSCCQACASGFSSSGFQCSGCPEGYTCDNPWTGDSLCCNPVA